MRVLVLATVFPNPARPTLGVFVRERVRHVARHCDVVVIAPIPWFPFNRWIRGKERATAPFFEEQDGLRVYHPRVLSVPLIAKCLDGVLYFLSIWPVAAWLRRRFPFDRIDAHFAYPDGLAGVLLGRVFRCPSVVTVRGGADIGHARYALRRPQLRFALRRATKVIAVSDAMRQVAVQLAGRPEVRVIPNGVDPGVFAPTDRGAARAALGLPDDRVILLAVGALIEGKGHHRVLELLPSLVRRHPEILYIAVGGDVSGNSYRGVIERLVRQHDLANHVRLVPARPHAEIAQWMAAADLFCLATQWEGWCNALTEALACGLPAVCTAVGGNAEFVRDGLEGFLVPFWDPDAFASAVLRALETRWDRAAIAARMRANSWERTAEKVVSELRACDPSASPAAGITETPALRILYHHRTRAVDAQGVHIAKMVQAFRARGHEVNVVGVVNGAAAGLPRRSWLASAPLPRWLYDGLSLVYNLYGFVVLALAIRRRRPHLLYERYSLNTVCGIWASRCFGVPIALEVNSPLYEEQRDLDCLALHRVARASQRWICSNATRTFVVTRRLGDILAEAGVPASRIRVLPNGIDPAEFNPEISDRVVRDRYQLEGRVVIGFVGWFRAWHGLELLLEAFGEMELTRRGAVVLLVGDGPALPTLKRHVDARRLAGNVTFTGPVPREEIAAHIAAFDIAVQSGATDYASPMKLFEYMAMAKCIVAPDQPNVREVLVDGLTAHLFPAGDRQALASTLLHLVDDPAERSQVGQRAWKELHSRGYLWSENARRVLDEVLGRPR